MEGSQKGYQESGTLLPHVRPSRSQLIRILWQGNVFSDLRHGAGAGWALGTFPGELLDPISQP